MSLEPNAKKARIVTDSVENKMDDVSAMVAGILSNDPSSQLESTTKFRRFLPLDGTCPENVIKSGVVTRLVEFLKKEDSPKLQYEAAWAITNLAYAKPEVVIDHGAVPILVQLLTSPDDDVPEQAIWALCNVAAGSIQNRDYVLSCGVLVPLLPQLHVNAKLSMLRIATWILVNLCRGQPYPPFDQVKPVVAALEQVLLIHDEELLNYVCWTFWHLSKGSEEGFRSVIEAGLVPKIVKLLQHSPPAVIVPALCTVGNFVSGDSQQTQCVINSGALPILANILTQDYDKNIKKLACWTISNITVGTEEQIQSVIDANLIPLLVNLAQNAEFDIKKVALRAISNVTSVEKEMIDGVFSEDPLLQLESTTNFRKILSSNGIPHTESVLQSGLVPRFVDFLKKKDSPKLQYEAGLVITYIASDKPEVVIEHGAVPILVQILASPNDDVVEQAIWALGNVAGGSTRNRDHVLSCGVLLPLLPHLNVNNKLSMLRIATRTLENLCYGQPPPLFDQVKPALPTLERLLHSADEQVLADACSAVWLVCYGSHNGIQSVIDTGLVPRLVQLLQHTSPSVLYLVRGIIRNILAEDNRQIQCVIDGGGLPILANMLTQVCEKSIKEACSIITNITAGTKEHIQSVIDANLIPILVKVVHNAEMDIKMRAVWAMSNATSGGSDDQVKYLVEKNVLKPLCDLLVCEDLRVILACLNGLENILKVGEADKYAGDHVNYYRQRISDAEGQAKIENLQSHDHNQIKDKAVMIVETYWPGEEDEKTKQPPR